MNNIEINFSERISSEPIDGLCQNTQKYCWEETARDWILLNFT